MMSLRQIHQEYDTQDKCMALLIRLRWPNGVECPRCGNRRVVKVGRPWNWVCKSGAQVLDRETGKIDECQKKTGYRFSPLVGTVFENTNYKLPLWFEIIYLITQSKKGMSALQVQRMLKEDGRPTAYKTAFYMCHRIRAMLKNDDFPKLMGIVEVDETFIGGKEKNKHLGKRNPHNTTGLGKTIVIGAIARKGNVVCQTIGKADRDTMMKFVRDAIDRNVKLVVTDEHHGYDTMVDRGRAHEASSAARMNTFAASYIPTQSNRSGRFSSAVSWAAFITLAKNTCRST
jgi:ISXO2-like transposase domain/Transposase zinc-ribbon domain